MILGEAFLSLAFKIFAFPFLMAQMWNTYLSTGTCNQCRLTASYAILTFWLSFLNFAPSPCLLQVYRKTFIEKQLIIYARFERLKHRPTENENKMEVAL